MKQRRDREWDYISHICKYCRRRFYNGRDRYRLHIRHHEMCLHPYWYVYKSIRKGIPRTFWRPRTHNSVAFVLNNESSIVRTDPTRTNFGIHIKDRNLITNNTVYIGKPQISDRLDNTINFKRKLFQPFHCKYCTESFSTAKFRNVHQRLHDAETLLHWCQYCNKCFSSASRKKEHEESHIEENPYKCKYCSQSFITADTKIAHEKIHMRPYQCKFCNQMFATASEKMEHQRAHVKSLQQCKHCSKPFSRLSDKTKHELTHAKDTEPQYQYDNKGPVTVNNKHESEIEENQHVSGSKKTAGAEPLQNDNEQVSHKVIPSPFEMMPSQEDIQQRIAKVKNEGNLNTIQRNEQEIKSLQVHMDKQDSIPSNTEIIPAGTILPGTIPPGVLPPGLDITDNIVLFHCKYCDKSFFSSESRNVHQMIHNRPYQCKHCNESFLSARDKMTHQRTHSKDQQFPCKFCEKPFSRISDKTKHETSYCSIGLANDGDKNVHGRGRTKDKCYYCMYCNKAFTTSAYRRIHEKNHSKEKPCSETVDKTQVKNACERPHSHKVDQTTQESYQCKYCQNDFSSIVAKNTHEKTHYKLYPCNYCNNSFSDKDDRDIHEETHGNALPKDNPYQCSYCKQVFSRMATKNAHEKYSHQMHQCGYCNKTFSSEGHKARHEKAHSIETKTVTIKTEPI